MQQHQESFRLSNPIHVEWLRQYDTIHDMDEAGFVDAYTDWFAEKWKLLQNCPFQFDNTVLRDTPIRKKLLRKDAMLHNITELVQLCSSRDKIIEKIQEIAEDIGTTWKMDGIPLDEPDLGNHIWHTGRKGEAVDEVGKWANTIWAQLGESPPPFRFNSSWLH